MKRTKVAVLFGGCSTEYEVSLQSAAAVIRHLDQKKYDVIQIGISKDGQWYRFYGDVLKIENDVWLESSECTRALISPSRCEKILIEIQKDHVFETAIDVVFPVLHGMNGEDGTIQGLLDLCGVAYVGCGVMASALCMDKDLAHLVAETSGVRVPKSVVLRRDHLSASGLHATNDLGYPQFVKPVRSGSSVGITKVRELSELPAAVQKAFQYDEKVVVEEGIDGFEVGCAVMGNQETVIGEVDEIELKDGFFDFYEKYHLDTSNIHLPARVSDSLARRIKATAIRLYSAFGCRGMARVDLFVTSEEEIVFNEINTIPGFTAHSRYPNMMKASGIPFDQLLERLIQLAIERRKQEKYPDLVIQATGCEKPGLQKSVAHE